MQMAYRRFARLLIRQIGLIAILTAMHWLTRRFEFDQIDAWEASNTAA